MTDKLHGKAANSRRCHVPISEWTDKEIFIDLFDFAEKFFKTDKNVHTFFDNYANRKNDYLFRKVLELKSADGVEWVHTVYVKYTKEKR